MIRSVTFFAVIGAAIAASSFSMAQTPVPSAHPLVGKWQWTRAENKCTEVYDFRADGTVPVTSGGEKTDNTYTITASPDQNGFYRLTMKTTKDYGGKDCADDESDNTGQESTTYVLFEPSKDMYIVCNEPKAERCFGPLRRVP